MAEKGSEAVIQWWNFTSILYMLSNRGLGAAPAKLLCKNVLSLLGNIRGHSHNVNEPRPIVNTWIGSRWGSSSSTRWKSRQGKDIFAREARVQGLKSRAAFKLLEVRILSFALVFLKLIGEFRLMPNTRSSKKDRLSLI